jgi:hypothetical protein
MRMLSLAVVVVLGWAGLGQAAPLDVKHVCAHAKWVAHLDVDAVRDSAVVKKAYDECMKKHPEAAKVFDVAKVMIGMDLRKDLHGITAYGPQICKPIGIVIVQADMDQKVLEDKAKLGPDYMLTTYGNFKLHSWTHKKGDKQMHATGAFFSPKVLVFGGSVEQVKGALDVLSGKNPNLGGKPSALVADIPAGATFVHRAIDLSANTKCPVLKQAETFQAVMGENKGESFYQARIVMKTGDAAENVKAAIDGFKALAALGTALEPDTAKLVSGLKVTREDKAVVVKWSASADAVWAQIVKSVKKMEEHKAKGHGPWAKHKAEQKKA